MAGILKVDKYQDFNGNDIMTSDGSGNITINNVALKNAPAFFVYLSSAQTIPNSTYTLAQFNTELWDSNNTFDTTTYKFTVPSGGAGKYVFSSRIKFSGLDIGEWSESVLYINGSVSYRTQFTDYSSATDYQVIASGTVTLNLSENDYVQLYVFQNEGASRDLFGGADGSWFSGYKLIGV